MYFFHKPSSLIFDGRQFWADRSVHRGMANRSVCSNESVKASGFSTAWRAEQGSALLSD